MKEKEDVFFDHDKTKFAEECTRRSEVLWRTATEGSLQEHAPIA